MTPGKREAGGEIDHLFSLDPSEFIAARDELAKRLKADGRGEEAEEIRGLRRPTVAAWAANRLAREQQEEVKELLAAGQALRQAQRKVLSGVKAGGFREAMDRRRRAVAALVRSAEQILSGSGKGSAGTVAAVQSTLEAASVDEEAGEQVRAGRLTRELSGASGLGGVTGLEVVAAPPERPARPRRGTEEDESARAELEAARREAKELERKAVQARRGAIKARADADRAQDKAGRLTGEAEEAKTAAKEAARKAREAEAQARRAEFAAERPAARRP
jgi:hypothetical protein